MFPNEWLDVMTWMVHNYPRQPLFSVGHSGIGKTSTTKQVGVRYVRLNATGMEPPDITGMPKLDGDVTRWLPPSMLQALTENEPGILVFDEINRVPTETRHVLMQVLDERAVGDWKMSDKVMIVLTANPDDPGYQVDALDTAFIRRCCVMPFEFHFDSFQTYAMTAYESPIKGHEGQRISARVLAAMRRNKQAFTKEIKGLDKFAQTPTPDGMVRCSELEQAGLYEAFSIDIVIQILSGIVGSALAASIAKDLNDAKLQELKKLLDAGKPLPEGTKHDMQIDLLYYVWEDYGSKPGVNARKIHHLFLNLNNDIKIIMMKLCAKFFSNAKTKAAFQPLRADWKKLMSEVMLKTKGVEEDEIKALLNSL